MKKKKVWKRVLIVAAIIILLLVVGKLLAGNKDKGEKVAVEKVARRTIIETVTASGNIYPEIEVKISPDISGEITELNVEEGDSVKKGQVLARIFADPICFATRRGCISGRSETGNRSQQPGSVGSNKGIS
jgi:HlyD family secretion protein